MYSTSTITVNDILRNKGHGYLGMPPGATAYAALEVMADQDVGALLVLDEGKLIGVFSERDYARKVILKGKSSRSTTVGELMSSPPICASPEITLQDCMVMMTNNHIRHLPVMENGAILGVVSIGDVVGSIIRSQEATIHQLENYISGDDYPAHVVAR
jgi:CBS domain-containing protein